MEAATGGGVHTHFVICPKARPQRLTGELQPVRGGTAFHPSFANLTSCRVGEGVGAGEGGAGKGRGLLLSGSEAWSPPA